MLKKIGLQSLEDQGIKSKVTTLTFLGSVIIAIVVAIEMLPWFIIGERIWSLKAYYTLMKFGHDLHLIGMGWAVVAMFSKVTHRK